MKETTMTRRKHKPPEQTQLLAVLDRMTPAQLTAAYRIAKDPKRGLRPFFTDAYAMIALRTAAQRDTPS
jgi:uncharacterized membrane protein YdbT with pleckstrin-like domain